jgi:hypothetical protein
MKKFLFVSCLSLLPFFSVSAFAADTQIKKEEKEFCDGVKADVYYPSVRNGKLPVIFFSHNGKQTKEHWGDYPGTFAEKGFLIFSIGYSDSSTADDISTMVKKARKDYAKIGDFGKVTLIGGCHGGAMFVSMIGGTSSGIKPLDLKTVVLLSLSEKRFFPEPHCPVLAIYSTEDRLGEKYRKVNRQIAEENVTEPKKIVPFDAAPHGNELVADDKTKKEVRAEIDAWVESHSR